MNKVKEQKQSNVQIYKRKIEEIYIKCRQVIETTIR